MTPLRLLLIYLRVGFIRELAYRIDFIIHLLQSLFELGTALAGLAVVFSYTDNLSGWRPDELVALLGVFFLVGGAISLVIQPSMQTFIEGVRQGSLDFILTKPEDAQMLVSLQGVDLWGLIDVGLGTVVLSVALVRLGERVGTVEAATFAGMLLSGLTIVYSFWLVLATLSFWFVRVENILYIFQSVYEAGRWPVSLYPGWLRYGLTFIVPIAFATTVPAEALTGRLDVATSGEALALAAALLVASRLFWRAGLRRYSGASA
jgi:ABC-2 type transport system permease protein